jgi:hypothetical protein
MDVLDFAIEARLLIAILWQAALRAAAMRRG